MGTLARNDSAKPHSDNASIKTENDKHQSVVVVAVVVRGDSPAEDEAAESLTTPSLASAPDTMLGPDAVVVVLVAPPIGRSTVCPTTHPIGPSIDSVIVTPKSSTGRAAVLSTTGSDFESEELELAMDDMTAVWIDNSGLNAMAVRMGTEAAAAVSGRLS